MRKVTILQNITIITLILTLALEINASETLSPKNRGSKKKPEEKIVKKLPKPKIGPQKYTVFDKQLVVENVNTNDILANYQAFYTETDEYNFNGMVLGYVTPWNNHGYDVAKIFGNKFTHICPVWLQIRRKGPKNYEITGTHDIDKKWVVDVRNAGRERKTKIVPRVLFDSWSGEDYSAMLKNPDEINAMAETLLKSCKQYKFDGYVVEVYAQVASALKTDILVKFIRAMSDMFLLENLDFILVVPPKRGVRPLFTEEQFNALYEYVTAFSLMTYDYSSSDTPGPNAPTDWIEETVTSLTTNTSMRPKILMGLNFYGNDYTPNNGGPIVAHEYVNILKKVPDLPLTYNPVVGEHYFAYKDDLGLHRVVFYPTLYSIFQRLDLAHKLNVGIAIWETGQGLDYFYDLL